jgi:hypothetical protein
VKAIIKVDIICFVFMYFRFLVRTCCLSTEAEENVEPLYRAQK